MTLFRLLKKYGASLHIAQSPSDSDLTPLTKAVTVLFDGKQEIRVTQEKR